jgi:hypothetical protein
MQQSTGLRSQQEWRELASGSCLTVSIETGTETIQRASSGSADTQEAAKQSFQHISWTI